VAEDAAAIARVQIETWRTAYRGIVPSAYLSGLSVEERTELWRHVIADPLGARFALVAADAGESPIAFAAARPERSGDPSYPWELYGLYVLPSHQRRGIGHALVQAVAAPLTTTGMLSMLLWVLETNSAGRTFYEKIGGTVIRTQPIEIGGASLTEVAYGWPRLDALSKA
jgi:GNAT superfamily N-acetyltransferase